MDQDKELLLFLKRTLTEHFDNCLTVLKRYNNADRIDLVLRHIDSVKDIAELIDDINKKLEE